MDKLLPARPAHFDSDNCIICVNEFYWYRHIVTLLRADRLPKWAAIYRTILSKVFVNDKLFLSLRPLAEGF